MRKEQKRSVQRSSCGSGSFVAAFSCSGRLARTGGGLEVDLGLELGWDLMDGGFLAFVCGYAYLGWGHDLWRDAWPWSRISFRQSVGARADLDGCCVDGGGRALRGDVDGCC